MSPNFGEGVCKGMSNFELRISCPNNTHTVYLIIHLPTILNMRFFFVHLNYKNTLHASKEEKRLTPIRTKSILYKYVHLVHPTNSINDVKMYENYI